jgi:hypothetical protein
MRNKIGCNWAGCAKRSIIQYVEVFPNCTWRFIRVNRLWLLICLWRGFLTIGVSSIYTGIGVISLTTRQACLYALCDHRLKNITQHILVAKTPTQVLGRRRLIWNLNRQIHLAEATIGKVQIELFAHTPFWLNKHKVSHQQHQHHRFWINPGSASGALKFRQMLSKAGQINDAFNRSQHMIRGDVIFYREIVKK